MDVSLGSEQMVTEPLASLLREYMALDEFYDNHRWLTVQTLFIDTHQEVSVACSEWQPERESLYHAIAMHLNGIGVITSAEPDPDEIGVVQLTVQRADAELDNAWWQERRELMLIGLRQIVAAWAHHRGRLVIACTHAGQYADDGSRMSDHIHIIYQKAQYDPTNLLCSEIEKYVSDGCSWESIDESLGIFGAAEMPEFDDEFDDQELVDGQHVAQEGDDSDSFEDEDDEYADYADYMESFGDADFERDVEEAFAFEDVDSAFDDEQ